MAKLPDTITVDEFILLIEALDPLSRAMFKQLFQLLSSRLDPKSASLMAYELVTDPNAAGPCDDPTCPACHPETAGKLVTKTDGKVH